ncbi:MAG: HAD hydrolase-like protein [Solirubrobacterales bacterium]|nr:HAD hydrolase-like protein [Solirubrobacterales bacterium]
MTPERACLMFDLDGCLVDSLDSIAGCWATTLAEFGHAAPSVEQLRPFVGPPAAELVRHFVPDVDDATAGAIVAAYVRCAVAAHRAVQAFPGIPEALEALSDRGLILAVATSKSVTVAEPLLERLGLRRWLACVEGTHDDELAADKATAVGRVLERLAPERTLGLVGDREHDVRGAHAHGIPAFGALWGYGSAPELRAAGADDLLHAPAELVGLVDRLTA